MDFPKISIVTPSYNQGQFLEQTIDSVLSQNYPNLEYFVMDGGSSDDSLRIIKKYESHLTAWVSEKDRGQSHAINKGLSRCTGEVFNWLNSDDYYARDTLKKVGEYFSDPRTQVLCGRSRVFGEGRTDGVTLGTDIYSNNLSKTIGCARIDQPETFFRKNRIDFVGPLNENLHYVMDREFWVRYLIGFGLEGIVEIPDVLVNFRLHQDSKTISKTPIFTQERDSMYYTLAHQIGEVKTMEHFRKNFEGLQRFDSLFFEITQKKLIIESIQYFFVLKADELYFQRKFSKAKNMIDFEPDAAVMADDVYKKLKNRLHWPDFLLKLLHNLR